MANSETSSSVPTIVSRRRFILLSFWTGISVALMGAVGSAFDFLYPRNVSGSGGAVRAGHVDDYERGGDPVKISAGVF